MFRPLSLFIGLRYTRAKRRNHFISFIALTSMVGIALGVAVLITVLSVMNGFDYEIKQRLFGMVPEVTIRGVDGPVENWQSLLAKLKENNKVVAAAPLVEGQAMMTHAGFVSGMVLNGIDPIVEQHVNVLAQKMQAGALTSLTPGSFNVLLGEELAAHLGVEVGDEVVLVVPQTSVSIAGLIPRMRKFHVSGIFKIGNGFHFDKAFAFVHLADAQRLLQMGEAISGVQIKISDLYQAPQFAQMLNQTLGDDYYASDWSEQYGAFFRAVQMEKTMMFLVLCLIIAVAAFNLVSSLVMVVTDKQAEIAILRTFGATPRMVMMIFIVQGAVVGIVGVLSGVLGGVLLALNVTSIVQGLERLLNMRLFNTSAYYVDYLPSRLLTADIWHITLAAVLMSLVATLYPAWRAARIQPVQALRYE